MVACNCQPEAVKYLLDSDKCTQELLLKRNNSDFTYLMIVSQLQVDFHMLPLNNH